MSAAILRLNVSSCSVVAPAHGTSPPATANTMLRLFPLRRSFSLDLAPDDSNSNFLLHANDDSDLNGHPSHVGAHLPVTSKSSLPSHHPSVLYPNMTAAVHWPVDDIDDALAADFDGSLSGLGIELGTASFNMSEALMALPSLSSLKHPDGNPMHHSTGHLNSNLLLTSSLQPSNLSVVRGHSDLLERPTSLERAGDSAHIVSANAATLDEKPVAVVHGKKNRLAYGNEDEAINTSAIKRFCLNNERDISNVHILLANSVLPSADEHHQCSDECFNEAHGHLRHSSSVPDLRTNFASTPTTNPQVSHSAASSPSSSSTSTPSTSFFSQIISNQISNLSSNCHSSPLTHELAHSASRHTSKFQYVLGASTSMAIKMHEETMTYLNQGQSYEIKLKKVGDLSEVKGKMLKTVLRVCFHDRRLQYMEKELIDQWKEQRPAERILEVDIPLSYGIHDVRNDPKINRSEFHWDPTKETGVFIRINCISTEFTPKKHGGEKGVPFRIVIETYCKKDSTDPVNCLHTASCQVKVFKPKGADRKHKTDREKMNKKPASEQEKFQQSYDCTVFVDCSLDTFNVYSLPGGAPYDPTSNSMPMVECEVAETVKSVVPSLAASGPDKTSNAPRGASPSADSCDKSASCKPYAFLFSDIENSLDLNFSNAEFSVPQPSALTSNVQLTSSTNADVTRKFLIENRFDEHTRNSLQNFSGADILLLNKQELIQICGLTDGIRLYNALHKNLSVKSQLSILICSPTDPLFRAIYLDSLTASELKRKILASILSDARYPETKCHYLNRLCIEKGKPGVRILVDDDVVRNLEDESLFVIELSKDYNGEFYAVLKPYSSNSK